MYGHNEVKLGKELPIVEDSSGWIDCLQISMALRVYEQEEMITPYSLGSRRIIPKHIFDWWIGREYMAAIIHQFIVYCCQ